MLVLSYGSRSAGPPQLTAILHLQHVAVGVGAEHLPTEETQHGHLTNIIIHYMIGAPGREGGNGRERAGVEVLLQWLSVHLNHYYCVPPKFKLWTQLQVTSFNSACKKFPSLLYRIPCTQQT